MLWRERSSLKQFQKKKGGQAWLFLHSVNLQLIIRTVQGRIMQLLQDGYPVRNVIRRALLSEHVSLERFSQMEIATTHPKDGSGSWKGKGNQRKGISLHNRVQEGAKPDSAEWWCHHFGDSSGIKRAGTHIYSWKKTKYMWGEQCLPLKREGFVHCRAALSYSCGLWNKAKAVFAFTW